MSQLLRVAVPFALLAPLAAGQAQLVTPIDPFDGLVEETFESKPVGQYPCIPDGILEGNGDLCTPATKSAVVSAGWKCECSLMPHKGERFGGSAEGGPLVISFDESPTRFGAWFATPCGTQDAKALFVNEDGGAVSSALVNIPPGCEWTWNGWEFAEGAKVRRIEIHGSHPSTGFVMVDSMELDITEPVGLTGTPDSISIATGGTHTFGLDAGSAHAGLPYLVVGSTSGTAPGFPIDQWTVPLNFDAWTLVTIHSPNQPPLNSTFGNLDPNGEATASLDVPVGLPSVAAGVTLHHAFVVLELTPTLLEIVFVSNAASLTLVP